MNDSTAVAIVGMNGRFPGARDLDEYWHNLRTGTCSVSDFDDGELLADGTDPADFGRADYVRSKGILADAGRFEPELFGFNRTEAAALDPQHRVLLEVAWGTLENAGYDPRRAPARTGVYVGGSLTEHMIAAYSDPRLRSELGPMQVRTLTDREFLAPWLSYRLGLDGPSLTVQTACSTSLTAVHLATQALLLGECDAALAGGVCVDSLLKRGYIFQSGGIFSPDGRCRPFDTDAAGTVSGNGAGLVLLRRLEDAIKDQDPIYAVIHSTAVTNDGSAKVGFTAPSVDRQTAAIVEAWTAAESTPAAAQYLEMHGTATALGDRIEVAAVRAAFAGNPEAHCAIGSVKSNIGHLDAAAGVAGLIKVALMLTHQTLVPMANVTAAHPDLGLDQSPLHLSLTEQPWSRPADGMRKAGISSVGIGGTNVHAVLQEAPGQPLRQDISRPELLPLSARTTDQLAALAGKLAAKLRAPSAPALGDIAHTLQTGRAALETRTYVLATDLNEAADTLEAIAGGHPHPGPTDSAPEHELHQRGQDWIQGRDVTWPQPAPGSRRVHLPTYPFAGEQYGALTLAPMSPDQPARPTQESPLLDGIAGTTPDDSVLERSVTELLSTGLGLSSVDDLQLTYFGVGGDSLTAIHLIGRLRDDYAIDLPIEIFFEELTLRELALKITAAVRDEASTPDLLESLLNEIAP